MGAKHIGLLKIGSKCKNNCFLQTLNKGPMVKEVLNNQMVRMTLRVSVNLFGILALVQPVYEQSCYTGRIGLHMDFNNKGLLSSRLSLLLPRAKLASSSAHPKI